MARQTWGMAVVAAALVLAAAESRGRVSRGRPSARRRRGRPWNSSPSGTARASTATITAAGGIVVSFNAPDRNGQLTDIVLGLRHPRPLPEAPTPISARSSAATATASPRGSSRSTGRSTPAEEQRREHAARREQGLRQGLWSVREVAGKNGQALELALHERGRRGGLPRHAPGPGDLHPHRGQRAPDRLRGHHRQAHGGEPDQPLLLQPRGPGRRRHPRPRPLRRRRPLHRRWDRASSPRASSRASRARPSTSAPPRPSARASTPRTPSSSSGAATTTTSC